MATLAGTALYIAQLASLADMSQRPDATQGYGAGMPHMFLFQLAFAGTESAADVQPLLYLPKGARVIPHLSRILMSGDPTDGNFTVHIGTATDNDCFAASVDLSAGGAALFTTPGAAAAELNLYKIGDTAIGPDDTLVNMTYATLSGTKTARTMTFSLAVSLVRG